MSRARVVMLAGALVLAATVGASARRTKDANASVTKKKTKKKSTTKAKTKSTTKHGSSKHHKKVAVAEKVSTSMVGMPHGFAWPPNELMKKASVACEQKLDGIGLAYEHATPQGRITDPIYVPGMEIGGIKYTPWYDKTPRRIDCQLVATLSDVGPQLYALGVREVHFGSIYRNTNVRVHGMTKNQLSRHALGIAMDIKEFVDDKGRVANVELDYLKGDPLLQGIEDTLNQTHRFRIVLTPANDPLSHYDHFHIEAAVDFTAFR